MDPNAGACRRLILAAAAALLLASGRGATGAAVDLGHVYRPGVTTCWDPKLRFDVFEKRYTPVPNGRRIVTESFATPEHCGTHMDAPYHFNAAGWRLEEIPLERTVAEGERPRHYYTTLCRAPVLG